MADNTKIEWADATLNYVNGCSLESPGCTNCYAMKQAHRFPVRQGLTVKTKGGMVWTGEVRQHDPALEQALRWRRGRKIFWNAHGDLFHPSVPDSWIDRQFAAFAMSPQHQHMVLTKRSTRMREYFESRRFGDPWAEAADYLADLIGLQGHPSVLEPSEWPLPNVWLGISAEDQQRWDERVEDLVHTPAAVRFVSAEPLLGPIDCSGPWIQDSGFVMRWMEHIDWVIAGGESGLHARPMHPDWARSLRDQCAAAGVAFHFKQWGEWREVDGPKTTAANRAVGAGTHWLNRDGRLHNDAASIYHDYRVAKLGKKRAGRLLDGVTHDAFPGSIDA